MRSRWSHSTVSEILFFERLFVRPPRIFCPLRLRELLKCLPQRQPNHSILFGFRQSIGHGFVVACHAFFALGPTCRLPSELLGRPFVDAHEMRQEPNVPVLEIRVFEQTLFSSSKKVKS